MLIFLNTSNEAAMAEGRKIGSEKDTKQVVSDPIEGIRSTPHSYPIHNQMYPIQAGWVRSTHVSDPSSLDSIHSLTYLIQAPWIRSTHSRIRSKLLVFDPLTHVSDLAQWDAIFHSASGFLRHMGSVFSATWLQLLMLQWGLVAWHVREMKEVNM